MIEFGRRWKILDVQSYELRNADLPWVLYLRLAAQAMCHILAWDACALEPQENDMRTPRDAGKTQGPFIHSAA